MSLPPGSTLGFIGAGAMATAIAKGVAASGLMPFAALTLADPASPRSYAQQELASKGAKLTSDNGEVFARCSIVILATKPDQVCPALTQERETISRRASQSPLFISIAAGLSLATIEAALPAGARVVRVMPNTPALVGCSASAFALGSHASPADASLVSALFGSLGRVVRVSEKDLNAVTGLSGSGPAYVFLFVEALADGGVRAGLTRAVAQELAIQTVLGSAQLLQQTGKHPGQLKDQVASPGGTTIAGIHALERGAFRSTVMDAVVAASSRAAEMGAPAAIKSKL